MSSRLFCVSTSTSRSSHNMVSVTVWSRKWSRLWYSG